MKKLFRNASLVLSGVGALVFGLSTNVYADVIGPTPSYVSSPILLGIVVAITAILLGCFMMEAKKGEEKDKDEANVKDIFEDNLKAKEMPVEEVAVGSVPEKIAEEKEEKEEKEEEKTEE